MPTKVSVGLCKKQGLPDYGSHGASCHVELELDSHLLDGDTNRFREHVRRAYAACREAIEDELSRDDSSGRNGHSQHAQANDQQNGSRRAATQSQIRAIKAIAGRNRIDLAPILTRFHVRAVADLDIRDASSIIDELKDTANGNGSAR